LAQENLKIYIFILLKDGLERLLSVYSNAPKMGDPQIVEKQVEQNKCEIDLLNEQINKFKVLI
jgi:hypothetical protein